MNMVRNQIPPEGVEDYMGQIKTACEAFNAVGITSVIDAGNSSDHMAAYQMLKEKGELTVRTHMMLAALQKSEPIENSVKRINEFPMLSGFGDELLKFQGLKILIDGGIGVTYLLMWILLALFSRGASRDKEARVKILIIDDSQVMRRIHRNILLEHGVLEDDLLEAEDNWTSTFAQKAELEMLYDVLAFEFVKVRAHPVKKLERSD